MSLYGRSPIYYNGAIANAELVPEIFPGWTLRIYCEEGINSTELEKLGCEIVNKPASRIHSGMFWRFLAAWDNKAERAIFRDADSRLNTKEAAAVKAWEKSGKNAHCMMDHPHHSILPLSGGMWGIKCNILPRRILRELLRNCRRRQMRVMDMRWLRDKVHPLIQGSLLRHSSVPTKWPHIPFPSHQKYNGFIGQQHDEKGEPIWPKNRRG